MSDLEPAPRLKWFTKLLVRGYFKLFHQYEVLGLEHLPPQPPVFVLTNHVSNLDVPAFALADPYVGSCLVAKESLTRTPIVKQVMHSWGAIPVARDGNDSSALREVLRKLREGRLVAIASEGTRNAHGGLGPTNPVLARLAIQASASGIPLIPLVAHGTYECLPRGAVIPKPGKVKVLIGPRFDLAYLKSWPRDEGVEEARRIIRDRLWVMMESGLPIAPPIDKSARRL
ncbi:MAG TPA: lysophospholipid acyltransferase family protein [Chloroflexota bacterium]|nr:lysophospholipid acyltransferase family protein [Chloroflexota bacterium]